MVADVKCQFIFVGMRCVTDCNDSLESNRIYGVAKFEHNIRIWNQLIPTST